MTSLVRKVIGLVLSIVLLVCNIVGAINHPHVVMTCSVLFCIALVVYWLYAIATHKAKQIEQ